MMEIEKIAVNDDDRQLKFPCTECEEYTPLRYVSKKTAKCPECGHEHSLTRWNADFEFHQYIRIRVRK